MRIRLQRSRIPSRYVLVSVLALTAAQPRGLFAQNPAGERPVPRALTPPDRFGPSTLQGVAAASLLLIGIIHFEPVEHVDGWTHARLAGGLDGINQRPRSGVRELGNSAVTFALAAGPLAYGLDLGDSHARRLGLQSLESLYLSATITRVLKTVVGRASSRSPRFSTESCGDTRPGCPMWPTARRAGRPRRA